MNIAEFFQGVDGGNSSKRMIGIPCGLIGLGMHCYLFFFGLTHQIVSYSDLSGTANDLLKVSAILLGLGVVENFKITKG